MTNLLVFYTNVSIGLRLLCHNANKFILIYI